MTDKAHCKEGTWNGQGEDDSQWVLTDLTETGWTYTDQHDNQVTEQLEDTDDE